MTRARLKLLLLTAALFATSAAFPPPQAEAALTCSTQVRCPGTFRCCCGECIAPYQVCFC